MSKKVTDYTLYKYRYWIAYGIMATCAITILTLALVFIPGALREAERQSAITSMALSFESFSPEMLVQLPYHLLQKASIELFGLNHISIKAPSIVLALIAIGGIYTLSREWFRENIALVSVLLTASIPGFMFMAQDGTPIILYVLLTIWLFSAAMHTIRHQKLKIVWRSLLLATSVLLMYVPMGVYMNIAIITTALVHPHIRHIVRKMFNTQRYIWTGIGWLALVSPLFYAAAEKPELLKRLLGLPEGAVDIGKNSQAVFSQLFNVNEATTGALLTPVFTLGISLLLIIGFLRVVRTYYTARSHVILIGCLIITPMIIINPELTLYVLPITFILLATAMSAIIDAWYNLFPRNPYARAFGILPIATILALATVIGVERYSHGYYYAPSTVAQYSTDLHIIKTVLDKREKPTELYVTEKEYPFYSLLSNSKYTVKSGEVTKTDSYYATRSHYYAHKKEGMVLEEIHTNRLKDNADRLYLLHNKQ